MELGRGQTSRETEQRPVGTLASCEKRVRTGGGRRAAAERPPRTLVPGAPLRSRALGSHGLTLAPARPDADTQFLTKPFPGVTRPIPGVMPTA